jgi:hypothetical protein
VYDIALEASRSTGTRGHDVRSMDFSRLFLYPFHSAAGGRTIALGGVFVVLALIGLFYRAVSGRYVNGLRVGVVVSFALWFVPVELVSIRSANYFTADPFIIFTIFLAALTFQTLWRRFPPLRLGLVAAALLQVVALVAGHPFYRSDFDRVKEYLQGKSVPSIKDSFENRPIYRFFERQPAIGETRIYLAQGAMPRLFGRSSLDKYQDYKFTGWSLHDLRLVEGKFKGIELNELLPSEGALLSKIRGDDRVVRSALTLDVLNIGYVLATSEDPVPPPLKPVQTFHLSHPDATIVAYRNPDAWPDAVVLEPGAKTLSLLPRRAGCPVPGLLCADFTSVARLRVPDRVRGQHWSDVNLSVDLSPASTPGVLMVSQLYRPGWEAELSNGHIVNGYRLFGGFTGFDLPPGVSSATVFYHPTARIVLTSVTWLTILLGLLFVGGAPLARRLAAGRAESYAARRRQTT